jgi:hypothetical protein
MKVPTKMPIFSMRERVKNYAQFQKQIDSERSQSTMAGAAVRTANSSETKSYSGISTVKGS